MSYQRASVAGHGEAVLRGSFEALHGGHQNRGRLTGPCWDD